MALKKKGTIFEMRKTAQKLIAFLKSESFAVAGIVLLLSIFVNTFVQIRAIERLEAQIVSLDTKLLEIQSRTDRIESRMVLIADDISEARILLHELTEISQEEDPESEKTVYNDPNKDEIVSMIFEIAPKYDISPFMIMAMIERESNYNPKATNGQYKGLLQITERWHSSRMAELGVTDLFDPAGNITVACSYLKDLYDLYEDQELVLMCYSMDNNKAMSLWREGQVSVYATAVIDRMRELEEGYGD